MGEKSGYRGSDRGLEVTDRMGQSITIALHSLKSVRNLVKYLSNCEQGDLHFWYSFRNDLRTLHIQALSAKLHPEGIKIIITR